MAKITDLISQYGILEQLAQYISTVDLFNLALSSSELYTVIRKSDAIFDQLKRFAICDGRGLKARQEFEGKYLPKYMQFWGSRTVKAKPRYDEEIEVRVWNLKCDAANALPCLKCGVNVCEECRWVPRVRDTDRYYSRRRPHRDPANMNHNLICYCKDCNEKVEQALPLSLSEYCDCDQYIRWICWTCTNKEDKEDDKYYRERTVWGEEGLEDGMEGMWLQDHQHDRAFWCPCGKRAPAPDAGGRVRCSWCRRRHNLTTWHRENSNAIPYFDNDPCYPKQGPRIGLWESATAYAILAYDGPRAP